MTKPTQIFIASLALFAGLNQVAVAAPARGYASFAAIQREDRVPRWMIGNWIGHNDFAHYDVDLQIAENGKASMTLRMGTNVQTRRGEYRSGRLEFPGEKFQATQTGDDLRLTRDGNRQDSSVLRKRGRPTGGQDLEIEGPRNNERVRSGMVVIQGSSRSSELQMEIARDRERPTTETIRTRDGRFENRMNLKPGHYEVVVRSRDRGRSSIERRISFDVTSDRTHMENPIAGAKLENGAVTIEGVSEGTTVEVEIYRGRDRVFIEQAPVRNGRFISHANLTWGTFVVTVRGKNGGEVLSVDKRGFEVLQGRGGPSNGELRLDRPVDRDRYRGTWVDFEGSSAAREVRIEIRRGRDQIESRKVSVRDGRFRTRIQLSNGHYDATISQEGRRSTDRRVSFDVSDR